MKKIKQTYHIQAPIEEVWKALTNSKYIDGWNGGPSKMSDKEGAKFQLWGGDIYGTNTKVVKNKLLVQDWYGGKWNEPSIAIFKLSTKGDTTTIEFSNENVPKDEFDDIEKGWKVYYLGPLKDLLEDK